MSARSWYSGTGYVIESSHVRCEAKRVRQTGPADFTIRKTCRDDSMPEAAYHVTDSVRVTGPGEYEVSSRFGLFRARWCHD